MVNYRWILILTLAALALLAMACTGNERTPTPAPCEPVEPATQCARIARQMAPNASAYTHVETHRIQLRAEILKTCMEVNK